MTFLTLRALLARIPGIAWVILLCVALVTGGAASLYHLGKVRGAVGEQSAALQMTLVRQRLVATVHDTIVVHDTVRLTRTLARYDTLRDTLNIHDTVQVLAFRAAADSAVHQCRQTVLDLLSSCEAKDTVIATQGRLLQLRGITPAPRGLTWREKVAYGAIGAAIDEAAQRIRR